MSFLEGTFARLQLGRHFESEADFLADKAVSFAKKVAAEYPKSETAMAAELALLCHKQKLEPDELLSALIKSGRHQELIETTRMVNLIQGIGPLDENGEIRVETKEDVVPTANILFLGAMGLSGVKEENLKKLTGMYEHFTKNKSIYNELMYKNASEWMIYEAEDPRVLM